jgi:hypothetical protein
MSRSSWGQNHFFGQNLLHIWHTNIVPDRIHQYSTYKRYAVKCTVPVSYIIMVTGSFLCRMVATKLCMEISVTNLTYEVELDSFHWLCTKLPVLWTLLISHFVMDILCLKYPLRFDIRTSCLRVFLFVSFTAIVFNSFHCPLFVLALCWKISTVDLAYEYSAIQWTLFVESP